MWKKKFWLAVGERVIRGGSAAVAGGFFVGDVAFDAMNVSSWGDIFSLFVGGGLASLFFSLAGNAITKSGPAFNNTEVITTRPVAAPGPPNPPRSPFDNPVG